MTTMRVVGECFFWYRLTRVFPDKFHRAVKRLCVCVYETKGYGAVGACKLLKEFLQKNWMKDGLDRLISKLRSTGDIVRKQGSGSPVS